MVCDAKQFIAFLEGCRDLYLEKPFVVDYCRCTLCGLVQQNPIPVDIGPFYEAYPIHRAKSRLYSLFRRTLMSGVYSPPSKWPENAFLLDFGCGDGWYLEWCREAGLRCVGFEANAAHATQLGDQLGLPILSDFEKLSATYAGKFDVVTLHFVVEHLTDIRGVFAKLRPLLRPGG
jgi:2-polyprenyl-3-methyl-5-hydroxy-6-metoxy-1,4-benzoquinol methylase